MDDVRRKVKETFTFMPQVNRLRKANQITGNGMEFVTGIGFKNLVISFVI